MFLFPKEMLLEMYLLLTYVCYLIKQLATFEMSERLGKYQNFIKSR